jgi:hypothetical protein
LGAECSGRGCQGTGVFHRSGPGLRVTHRLRTGVAPFGGSGQRVLMPRELPEQLLTDQRGALARRQAEGSGLDADTLRNQLRNGRWQRPFRGVYLTFSGDASRTATLWAALLRAGPGATLSRQTAAELHGLTDEPSELIHITVPAARHPARHSAIPGVVIHRSTRIAQARHPAKSPPCTRVEDTVLDLVQVARTFDEALGWLCRATGRRLTTADRIMSAMGARKKMRWRAEVVAALGDIDEGVQSPLEHRYVCNVERPHGLPVARRQVPVQGPAGRTYLDNLYEEYRICVELDGTAAHPADSQWRDKRRDNWNLITADIVTLRFGWDDVVARRCETARDVAIRLRRNGWRGAFRPCPRCAAVPLPWEGPLP